MNLLARIFSHGFALAVVVIIAIILMYRGELFPGLDLPEFLADKSQSGTTAEVVSGTVESTADEIRESTDSAAVTAGPSEDSEQPLPPVSATTASDQPSSTDPMASGASAVETADEASTTVDESPSAVTEAAAPAETAPPAAEEVVPAETAPTAAEAPGSTPTIVPPMESLAAQGEEAVPQTVAGTASESPYKVMAEAREAYWLRDFEMAEQHYRNLIQLDPDNPDGYGEMGNMYFSQAKWDEAAAAYYEAGTRLLEQGHVDQARQMLEVIRGLNGPRADDLESQISAVFPSSP
jgi:hypothetical protein